MTSKFVPDFVILAILDGWGIAAPGAGNAIELAKKPNMDRFWASYPHTVLKASGEAVGLPRGEDGNTETGHLNLGAGRIVYQDLERINVSIADGTFFQNPVLIDAVQHAKKNNSSLHLMGLIGAGGVHSNIEHLFALIKLSKELGIQRLFLHLFTDGRDSPPTSALTYIREVENTIRKEGIGQIASIMGRYWAMDRDQRWDRTEKAYLALTKGNGKVFDNAEEAITSSYSLGKTDEFIEPSLIAGSDKVPVALIEDNDAVIFFNFRIDRPRQLTKAFVMKDFSKANINFEFDPYLINYEKTHLVAQTPKDSKVFDRGKKLENLYFVTMTDYSKALDEEGAIPAFPPEVIEAPIGSAVSIAGNQQLRITESEKERFVTFYFNGLREKPFEGEERVIIPSPKVTTYDKAPEMSCKELTDTLIYKAQSGTFKLIVVNFPNADMVGHTGNIAAAIKAIETVDHSIGLIADYVLSTNGALFITADHGNAEEMIDLQTNSVDTEHSTNPVPFIAVSSKFLSNTVTLPSGILADVSPTILSLLNIPVPSSMTGRNLLQYLDL